MKLSFNIFHSECHQTSRFISKLQQTSEKYEACFNIFHNECRKTYVKLQQITHNSNNYALDNPEKEEKLLHQTLKVKKSW